MSSWHLETSRLRLRPIVSGDAEGLRAIYQDTDVIRYLPWTMRSDEEASVAAAKATQQHSFHEVGDYLVLGIELKSDGVFIGQLNAMFRSVDMAEFGYVLNSSAQGHGYATEAAEALIEALWTEYPFVRIEAHLDSRNLASRGVAERLGLRHEPEHDLVTQFKGEEALSLTFALTRPGESQEK